MDQAIEETLKGLQSCYDASALDAGLLTLQLVFDKDGAPLRQPIVHTDVKDCGVTQCVASKFAAIRALPRGRLVGRDVDLFLSAGDAPRIATTDEIRGVKDNPECLDKAPEMIGLMKGGRLPPEVIQKEVRSHYSKFRSCYEVGLARNATLKGKVQVRFVVDRSGNVSEAQINESTMPDCEVARCIRDHYKPMKFPPPERGTVTVVYPIMFEPG
jgi:TonB family protein